MSNLSTSHPTIALHVSDQTLTPLLSSSQSLQTLSDSNVTVPQAQALNALTSTSITTYETARRLALGLPQRVIIETANDGPILLQSYLDPTSVTPRNLINRVDSTDEYLNDLLDVGRPSTGVSDQTTINGLENVGRTSHPLTNGFGDDHGANSEAHSGEDSTAIQPPPMLFSTVVVPRRSDLDEGRTVAMRIERMGRQFQREWLREQVTEREQASRDRSADGSGDR